MRQILWIALLLLALTLLGTIGLRLTTDASWFDCLYMAVITLTTVGYGESIPLDDDARLFIIGYLGMSIGVFTFSAFQLGSILVSSQTQEFWRRRRMTTAIERLSGHFIICGIGRMGTIIGEYLQQRHQPFVIIDRDEQRVADICEERGWLAIVGDATDDQTLLDAGITRARSLASVLPTDSDNVYVVLSARMLATSLQIIARASNEKAVQKLEHAGATRVVSPFTSGAVKMARFMLTPSIEDFLEIADAQGRELELAEVQIPPDSPYVGMTLADTDLRQRGIMVIGIRRANGVLLMPPAGNVMILSGDSLFAFGSAREVNQIVTATAESSA